MNMKKLVLAAAVSCVMATAANASEDMGHGKITFKGSVIDAPCSIDAKSLDQTIQLGAISKNQLAKGGKSTPVDFSIVLHDCDTATFTTASIAFNGYAGEAADGLDSSFAVTGQGAGVGVTLTNMGGKVLKPNVANDLPPLADGDNELEFQAFVQGTTASAGATPGTFQSIANFVMDYQ